MDSTLITVLLCTDDNYWQHVGATIASLLASSPGRRFRIIVCSSRANAEGERRIREIAPLAEFVNFSPPDVLLPTGRYLTVATYLRLFFPEFLDEGIEKLIYLDCDLVVCRDIWELWNTDLSEFPLAAVPEPSPTSTEDTGSRPRTYYNAGVLLINATEWRREGATAKLLDYIARFGEGLFAFDQDALNAVFAGRIKKLSYTWNFHSPYADYSAEELGVTRGELAALRAKPGIVHFVGPAKPWLDRQAPHYRELYWQAVAKTPWARKTPPAPLRLRMQERMNWYFPRISAWIREAMGRTSRAAVHAQVVLPPADGS